ncbi:MAG: SusD/RagB family nutrient-binding outer membrane lipoprotein [Cyclobacteriaceae bacterium]|nr:SusD/RagB family nutrient-binding outer membrane lipoprotein [Cyclobacteriaceae bacterium]
MKYLNKLILVIAGVMLISVGCDTEDLHELNINPQAVDQIDVNYLFSAAELSLAANGASGDNRYTDWRVNIGLMGGYIQQLSNFGGISSTGNFYRHNEESVQAIFEFSYNDQLKNLAEVIKQTGPGGFAEGTKLNTRAAARMLRAWTYFRLTDFYGAIPYFEANQGIEGIFFPAYDEQSAIYPHLLNELDEAVASISSSNPDDGFASADMIYQGNIDQWKKFGNSLMLRYGMRVSDVDAAMANTYVTKAVQGGVFTSNDDNVWIPMSEGPSEWTNQNGISRAFYPGDGGEPAFLSATFIDFLKGTDPNSTADDDPRLMVVSSGIGVWDATGYTPTSTDPLDQLGILPGYSQVEVESILGLGSIEPQTTFSRINVNMLDDDDPYMIMNYAEVAFLLAEAAERGIGGVTGAEQHYNAGVRAAMQMYEPYFANDEGIDGAVSDPEVDAYLAAYPYGGGGVTGTETNLEQIGYQLWASHFLNWYDAWTDWRRTDFPPLVANTSDDSPVTGGIIAVRLPYPNIEVASNANFNQASNNNYTSRVWWDVD